MTAVADHALKVGRLEEVVAVTARPLEAALQSRFERLRMLQAHAGDSVQAGREYVAAYVDYVHFVGRLAALASDRAAENHVVHSHD